MPFEADEIAFVSSLSHGPGDADHELAIGVQVELASRAM